MAARSLTLWCGLLAASGSVLAQSDLYVQTSDYYAAAGAAAEGAGSVAIAGNIVVMGVPLEDAGGTDTGAVYVFERSPSGWTGGTQLARLSPSTPKDAQVFGQAVAIAGDTIVVGGPSPFASPSRAGEVYVFEKPAGGWADMTETAVLTASDSAPGDTLGFSVDIDGDTVVAGAQGSSSVYVYEKPPTGWANGAEVARLTETSGLDSWLGWAVAIDGDTVVSGAARPQRAFVYRKPATGWVDATETAFLFPSDGATRRGFAQAVDVEVTTVVVGANSLQLPGLQPNGVGAAYIYEEPPTGWSTASEHARLTADNPFPSSDQFGNSVALDGDKLVVAAPLADLGICPDATGQVFYFERPVGGWATGTEDARMVDSWEVPGFGGLAAIDNGVVVAAGSAEALTGNTGQGAVHVFEPAYEAALDAPVLTAVVPATVSACGAPTVTLHGQRLQCVSVSVGGFPVIASSGGPTSLDFALPPFVGPGSAQVVVMGPGGASNPIDLLITPDQPVLSSLSYTTLANSQFPRVLRVDGTSMDCVSAVSVGGVPSTIQGIGPTHIDVRIEIGLPIGTHQVVATGPQGPTNALSLTVDASHPSWLSAPQTHPRGETYSYRVFTDVGWNALYLLSGAQGTTAIPGIVSFEIGGGLFANIVPILTLSADAGGVADLIVTMPPDFPAPFTLYWEAMTTDPGVPLGLQVPLETSNADAVTTNS